MLDKSFVFTGIGYAMQRMYLYLRTDGVIEKNALRIPEYADLYKKTPYIEPSSNIIIT